MSVVKESKYISCEVGETIGSESGLSRYHLLPLPIKAIFLSAPIAAIFLFIIHWFSIPIFGDVLAGTSYYYLLYAVLGFNVFMGLGASRKLSCQAPPWYDYAMALTLWGITIFFLTNSGEIASHNWDSSPNFGVFVSALLLGGLSIEAGRRVGGWGYAILIMVSIVYPLFASHPWLAKNLGGVFYGVSFPFQDIMSSYAFGANGILGVPAQMLGELVLGFFLFAGLVMGMGGGHFFMNLATALMGRVRGGQAKVAVLASGFFGSVTGSAIANIAGTGSFTIPAMKRAGYEPEYAGAIEACASSGSDTMPPVMGGMVFLMVVMFGVDYGDVVIAAFLPSLLFYLGLLVQVDCYAAKNNLRGLPREEVPKLGQVLLEGWVYIVGLAVLVVGLVYMRWGPITPVYASATVVLLHIVEWAIKRYLTGRSGVENPPLRVSLERAWKRTEVGLVQTAGIVNYAVAIFVGMGFLLVGLLKTGVAAGLAGWIVGMGGDNLYLILFVSFAFCMIMGTFGLERTAYIFLAIIAVPAIVAISKTLPEYQVYGGLPIIGLNLFLMSYSNLGGITPPVALNAYVAAGIAGANPNKTAWVACRLAVVLLFLPFFYVLKPSLLVIYTPWWQTVPDLLQAATGIWLLASGLGGYLVRVGSLNKYERVLLVVGGFLLAFPEWMSTIAGLLICLLVITAAMTRKRLGPKTKELRTESYSKNR